MNTRAIIFAVLLIGLVLGYYFGYDHGFEKATRGEIDSFDDCAAAGYPIMESYPEQCRTPDGKNFVRDISGDSLPPGNGSVPGGGEVACTMEAKLCPDGSYVGRSGPNCEFAPCL